MKGQRGGKRFLRSLLTLVLLACAGWFSIRWVPLPKQLFEAPAGIVLLDRNGRPLRQIASASGFSDESTSYSQIPRVLIDATLAAEDKRFWTHHGVDWRATLRASWTLLRHRRVVSGASTITQQLIKLAQPRPRTLWTKFVEAAQALRLEQVCSKQQILAAYFNRLDYGNLVIGCAAASDFYFGKPLGDLSTAEAALLAGLPQSPTRLNPHRRFEQARKRQEWILGRMQTEGLLTEDARQRAASEGLRFRPPRRPFLAPHFVDLLWQLHHDELSGRVRTSLDLPLNDFVETAMRRQLATLRERHVQNGAAIVLENRTGQVLALVGSEDYFAPVAGQVNGAWAARSAGSTFKPFTYLLAFEAGATPASIVADVPTEFSTSTGVFAPLNYNGRFYGPMRYRLALANSLNVSAVKVLASCGDSSLSGTARLRNRLSACGLTTLTNSSEFYGLGLTIGNAEARLLELANAYACLARLGEYKPYQLQLRADAAPQRLLDPAAAYLIADILSDNEARTLAFGPDSDLRFEFPVACKTGTSSDYRDNWAFGYTPEFTVGVWVGNFDGTPMNGVSGVSGAAPILHEVFQHLHERSATSWYSQPEQIVQRKVHPLTGKLLTPHSTSEFVIEKFIRTRLPPIETASDYDPQGRVRLSPEFAQWWRTGDNWLVNRAVIDASSPSRATQIVSPLAGTIYFLNPDLPVASRSIPLRSSGPAGHWQSDSLEIRTEQGRAYALMKEGTHQIALVNAETGATNKTWITIKAL